jgi:hypothetical protein
MAQAVLKSVHAFRFKERAWHCLPAVLKSMPAVLKERAWHCLPAVLKSMPAVLKERACQPCFNGDVHVKLNFRVTS